MRGLKIEMTGLLGFRGRWSLGRKRLGPVNCIGELSEGVAGVGWDCEVLGMFEGGGV